MWIVVVRAASRCTAYAAWLACRHAHQTRRTSAQLQNFSGGRTVMPRKLLAQVCRPAGSRLFILLLLMPGGLQAQDTNCCDVVCEQYQCAMSTGGCADADALIRVATTDGAQRQDSQAHVGGDVAPLQHAAFALDVGQLPCADDVIRLLCTDRKQTRPVYRW